MDEVAAFPRALASHAKDFSSAGCKFDRDETKAGTGRRALSELLPGVHCYTLEISMFCAAQGNVRGEAYSPSAYTEMGQAIGLALHEHYCTARGALPSPASGGAAASHAAAAAAASAAAHAAAAAAVAATANGSSAAASNASHAAATPALASSVGASSLAGGVQPGRGMRPQPRPGAGAPRAASAWAGAGAAGRAAAAQGGVPASWRGAPLGGGGTSLLSSPGTVSVLERARARAQAHTAASRS